MKVIVFAKNYGCELDQNCSNWHILADSTVSNIGKPFYLPEDVGTVSAYLTVAVRVSRLGKHIEPRFAGRYYSEWAPALNFRLPDIEQDLLAQNLSSDRALNFDRALFVGEFRPVDKENVFYLLKNNIQESEFKINRLKVPIDHLISEISWLNTLKMGDLILPGLSGPVFLSEGDLLEVDFQDNMEFQIKVK